MMRRRRLNRRRYRGGGGSLFAEHDPFFVRERSAVLFVVVVGEVMRTGEGRTAPM